ncbi:MAG: hydrogenase nickel incorporation protein HypB [Burkholderiaceae bacterium]|nr:hydrogenase nickel incorporation protein HypB [Burkholderiaceae bacterium]
MCVVCGCGTDNTAHSHAQAATAPAVQAVQADRPGDLHYGLGRARVSVPGLDEGRAIQIETDVLGANDRFAADNRAHFAAHGVAAWNLVSSPGSGKTTLLCATIDALRRREPDRAVAVIEGDQQTTNDADRIRATGVPAIQVNTGKGCHLDAQMVGEAFARLPLHGHGHAHDDAHDPHHEHGHGEPALLFIENVGNLVCPAMWDLGERAKVAILSVTEGEDKPLKYPDMFAAARLMVLTKTDLLPHLDFDVERCVAYARRVNPGIEVLLLSARSGIGMDAWLDWLLADAASPAPTAGTPRPESALPACHR